MFLSSGTFLSVILRHPFRSSCHVDSKVTPKVLVGVFTLEVGFTGVNVPFVIVVGVYVYSGVVKITPHRLLDSDPTFVPDF